jgi:hypothetical protein
MQVAKRPKGGWQGSLGWQRPWPGPHCSTGGRVKLIRVPAALLAILHLNLTLNKQDELARFDVRRNGSLLVMVLCRLSALHNSVVGGAR